MDDALAAAVQAQFDAFPRAHHGATITVARVGHWLHVTNPTAGVIVSGVHDPSDGWHLTGRLLDANGVPSDLLYAVSLDMVDPVKNYDTCHGDPHDPYYLWSTFADTLRHTMLQANMRPLILAVPGLLVDTAGGAYPFQAEGTLHGLPFYFRYRSGHATLRLFSSGGGDDSYFAPLYLSSQSFGDDLDGSLTFAQFRMLFTTLVGQLARSPRLWEFDGVQVDDFPRCPAGTARTYGAWGHTPQEAFAAVVKDPAVPSVSAEKWDQYVTAMALNPVTVTTDDRVWPDPEPVFTLASPLTDQT